MASPTPQNRNTPAFDPAVLLGEPVGQALSRTTVDGSDFATKQQRRPAGMNRAQYMGSGPGEQTRMIMLEAGVASKSPWWIVGAACAIAAATITVTSLLS